ncbi:MAG: VCBS repeat-containing protein, partial [Ignavibacteriae bacterium]|nr:VCBS repeat-containing protein [Ignavibacteriota bacterium]
MKIKSYLYLIVLSSALLQIVFAKPSARTLYGLDTLFTEVALSLPGCETALWADYDNDGDLDLLLVGGFDSTTMYPSRIYRNDYGTFIDIGASLSSGNRAAWGDYDNDGDLDIVVSGPTGLNNSNPVTKIYRNDNGTFVDINAPLLGVVGTVAWADYDNDDDLDLFVTGSIDNGYTYSGKLYRNDNGSFVDIGAGLPGMWASSVAWGDYDNDGDLDVLLSGWGYGGTINKIFRNDGPLANGGWIFTDILVDLYPIANNDVAWGDYDSDGDLDIAYTGTTYGYSAVFKIYRNDGGTNFVDINASLQQLGVGAVAWGDHDNDGDLDLAISGSTDFFGANPTTKIYRNDNGIFVDLQVSVTGTWHNSLSWGDYDNDGDLDILMGGLTSTTPPYNFITKIYRNNLGSNSFTSNTVPTAPTDLSTSVSGNAVTLNWNRSTDNQTSQNGLTYNLRIGTSHGGVQEMSPMANVSTGYRKIVQLGNTYHRNSWTIKNLPPGAYYWSVQAIDGAFAGSVFAQEGSFSIEPGTEKDTNVVALWHFDEGSGNILHDASPYHNDGVIHNATWVPGRFGLALHFNGLTSYVVLPNSPSLKLENEFTLEAWLSLDTLDFGY